MSSLLMYTERNEIKCVNVLRVRPHFLDFISIALARCESVISPPHPIRVNNIVGAVFHYRIKPSLMNNESPEACYAQLACSSFSSMNNIQYAPLIL